MRRLPTEKRRLFGIILSLLAGESLLAADEIQVSDVVIDSPTVCCLGFSVPITGDDDFDATASIEYRLLGSANWLQGLPLLRVRPEFTSDETRPSQYGLPNPIAQFAGSLFYLAAASDYEIRIAVSDPDGGSRTQIVTSTTRSLPRASPASPRAVAVSDSAELASAISAAQPGDVINLAAGNYTGSITVNASGSESNPIIIRGVDKDSVSIDASGATYGVTIWGSHVYLEHVTVSGSTWGARSFNTEGVVIQHSKFTDVSRGIFAKSGTNRNFYICDNILEGSYSWPNVSSATWNDEGITVSGEGHTVCNNRLSGFGDALGLANSTSIPNVAIDFYGNDILWTGDDALELDFAHRNVRAFGNRLRNSAMGASLQPVWGGPVYIFRNVFQNIAKSAFKLNNDPSGFFIFHNTSARTQGSGNWGAQAWTSLGYTQSDGDPAYAANFKMLNNVFVGLSDPAYVTTDLILAEIDHNGWKPDGEFRFVNEWVNFADLQSNSGYEANGKILSDSTFASPLTLPADYTTFWPVTDLRLSSTSQAIDAAQRLPNINDVFSGSAPDIGAIEFGDSTPHYGPTTIGDTLAPAAPENVRAE